MAGWETFQYSLRCPCRTRKEVGRFVPYAAISRRKTPQTTSKGPYPAKDFIGQETGGC